MDTAALRRVLAPLPARRHEIRQPTVIPADLRRLYRLDRADRPPEAPNDPGVAAGLHFDMVTNLPPEALAPARGGLRAVVGFRAPLGSDGERHRTDVWRWEVPQELSHQRGVTWSEPSGERYRAVLFAPGPLLSDAPVLALLDARSRSGLLWMKALPLAAALSASWPAVPSPASTAGHEPGRENQDRQWPRDVCTGPGPWVAVSRDGSRVLMAIGLRGRSQTLAIVFDRAGNLCKAVAFNGIVVCHEPQRSPGGSRVLLCCMHHPALFVPGPDGDVGTVPDASISTSYFLADLEGTLVQRFVGEDGRSVSVGISQDDRYAVSYIHNDDKPAGPDQLMVYPLP